MKITARHLIKVYKGGVYALNDFNVEIQSGEFVCVLGPSGCGKTTFLRLISGLDKLTAGELYFDDILFSDLPVKQRDSAFVFQDFVLYPQLSVWENVAVALQRYGLDRADEDDRVYEVLKRLDLLTVQNQLPRVLSGGQQQRVALARAIVKHPTLLLFDEPLANIAEEQRQDYMRLIRQLKDEMPQTTFVYVTHNVREALALSSKLLLMSQGKVVRYGSCHDIWQNPYRLETLRILDGIDEEKFSDSDEQLDCNEAESSKILTDSSETFVVKNKYDNNKPYLFDKDGTCLTGEREINFFKGEYDGKTLKFGGVEFRPDVEFNSHFASSYGKVDVGIASAAFRTEKLLGDLSVPASVNGETFDLCGKSVVLTGKQNFGGFLYVSPKDIYLYRNGKKILSDYQIHHVDCVGYASAKCVKIPAGKLPLQNFSGRVAVSFNENSMVTPVRRGGIRAECIGEEFVGNGQKRVFLIIKGFNNYITAYASEDAVLFPNKKLRLTVSNLRTEKIF